MVTLLKILLIIISLLRENYEKYFPKTLRHFLITCFLSLDLHATILMIEPSWLSVDDRQTFSCLIWSDFVHAQSWKIIKIWT